MAIELENPNVVVMSPRISFSHDISQMETVPVEQYIRSTSSSSSIDFDFCVFRESFDLDSSSADELFSDGKILPIEIKRRLLPSPSTKKKHHQFQPSSSLPKVEPQYEKDNINYSSTVREDEASSGEAKRAVSEIEEKQSGSKSFWRFKRSTSLNCGSGYARTLCPLPLLSRSNSTGSATSSKRSAAATNSTNSQKFPASSSAMKQSHTYNSCNHHQKPPLKKKYGSHHGNGVKINPVLLNVPTGSLFGLGSIFSGAKERTKKK